ncbi:brinker DNA-binding domain-containing protein [Ditylenchus destructor]|uniref:Brinker DNA-binding domain-containing protein n=1 Tax=Ditylenchus destructor TaxID=166010 RepID=A0AAD4MJD5_9BILA|nr:brinker DNA-binding domain-containing protein [Ditylenchus destructor]
MDIAAETSTIPARESRNLEAAGKSKAPRKSYTIARKLEVVDFVRKNSIHSAAKKYNLDRNTIRPWLENEKQLRITEASMVRDGKKKNLSGAGPPLKDDMFDKRLAAWVRDNRRIGIKVTRSMMVEQAQKMYQPVFGPGIDTTFNAPDVSWNMPFKQHIQREYNNWMLAADREWTVKGNPRAPGMEVYLGWISNAWESLTREAIQKSFKTCGITNNPDGSEDHMIHCLRPEGSIPLGQDLLRKARLEKDVEVIIPEEPDEDEDLNNGYKSDENLA